MTLNFDLAPDILNDLNFALAHKRSNFDIITYIC